MLPGLDDSLYRTLESDAQILVKTALLGRLPRQTQLKLLAPSQRVGEDFLISKL